MCAGPYGEDNEDTIPEFVVILDEKARLKGQLSSLPLPLSSPRLAHFKRKAIRCHTCSWLPQQKKEKDEKKRPREVVLPQVERNQPKLKKERKPITTKSNKRFKRFKLSRNQR